MTDDATTDTGSPPISDVPPETNHPGLRDLREAVANYAARYLPHRASLRQDAVAGLTVAVSSVPDGMAGGVLAGVNPIYGLYACMVGPVVGGIVSSTALMVITTTSAASLVAGQSIAGLPAAGRDDALFMMVVLAGLFQVLFGVLGLGRLTRFVSYSVMAGFLSGISVVLILSQLPVVTGHAVRGSNRVTQTLQLLEEIRDVSLPSIAIAALTLVVALTLRKTRVQSFASLVAITVATMVTLLFGAGDVQVVRDVGTIPRAVPQPLLPAFAAAFDVMTGALALALIILVQGAGVSQTVPNPDGSRSRASRDFIAQGAANIASGLFRGLPVGGSLGTTAVNLVSGAQRRWAAIFSGLWMAAIVIGLPGVVSRVAMPALGALLVLAGARNLKPEDVRAVWNAGWPSRLAGGTTFLATLLVPIQAAVGIGVTLSALLYINESSTDVSLVELVERDDGFLEERSAPERLPANAVTTLDVYGHLFYAGARTLERLLPSPRGAAKPVVILRLRGYRTLGATLMDVLGSYARQLDAAGGRLYLTGLSDAAYQQVVRSGKLRLDGPVSAFRATPVVGESTRAARAAARAWLIRPGSDAP